MALIRINAEGRNPVLHSTKTSLWPALRRAMPSTGPITIMLHGYKFAPNDPDHCPHSHIFAAHDATCGKAITWPRRLGFLDASHNTGLGVAFGWNARGSLKQALRSALRASHALAKLITELRDIAPDRQIHLIGHSMGAYVALSTLRRLQHGDVGRIVLLNGAVFRPCVALALRTPAGRSAELFNVVSSENAFYDILFERLLGRNPAHDRSIGRGFEARNAVTIRLGDAPSLESLAEMGHTIAPPKHWFCHWSPYLRPGAMAFYGTLLRHPQSLPLSLLKSQLSRHTLPMAGRTGPKPPPCGTA